MRRMPASFWPRLRTTLPWIVFGFALVLATEPAWRIPLRGFNPTLDELLEARCLVW